MRDPINPADIRVGDRVERVYVSGDHETIERFKVEATAHRAVSSGGLLWGIDAPRVGTVEWFLLDRPDPDKALIEAAAWRAFEEVTGTRWQPAVPAVKEQWRQIASATLAAIRFDHDVTPRAEQ